MNFQEFKKLTGLDMSLEEAKYKNPLYNKTEKELLEAVKENGYAIQYIHNPSEQVQLETVKKDGYAIQYIDMSKLENG